MMLKDTVLNMIHTVMECCFGENTAVDVGDGCLPGEKNQETTKTELALGAEIPNISKEDDGDKNNSTTESDENEKNQDVFKIEITDEDKEKSKSELDRLFEEVGIYRTSKEYENLFLFIRRFPRIAPYNAMLLNIQKPGSTFVATVREWKRYGRYPKPGARPLMILKTFGPVKFVYELQDTDGRKLPDAIVNPFKAEGNISKMQYEALIKAMPYVGVAFYTADYGTEQAGQTEINKCIRIRQCGKKKYYIPYSIVINENYDKNTQFATICHELGHVLCGHLMNMMNDEDTSGNYVPERYMLDDETMEFEAESVCWLVCERMGLHNPSAEYLSMYLKQNKLIPEISLEAVLRAAGIIEKMMRGEIRAPHRGLVIKKKTD